MKAIEAGYNVLLEKTDRAVAARMLPHRRSGAAQRVIVGVCHVLRYHPYFIKIRRSSTRASWERSYQSATSQPWGSTEPHGFRPRHVAPRGDPPTRC